MSQTRFDRNRFLIGTYCLGKYARSEEHVRALRDAGIDFVCAAEADRDMLDLFEKYGIGLMAAGVLPPWWGGYGEGAGTLEKSMPVSLYEAAARDFRDHPAIWGLDMGDEPCADDFPQYGELYRAARRLFPQLLPYLNLYPGYAVVPETTLEERRTQLGRPSYREYIAEYLRCVDSDYVCYDHYMPASGAESAYSDLAVVSDACIRSGRDMWIVLQANSRVSGEWTSLSQLRHQAYTALAFGARCVSWACWTAGWWHGQVLDEEGRPTQQYAKICAVDRELRAIGERYMRLRTKSAGLVGPSRGSAQMSAGSFSNVRADGADVALGHMESPDGRCDALMAADISGLEGRFLSFRRNGPAPRALLNGLPVPVLRTGPGEYRVRLEPYCGVFID